MPKVISAPVTIYRLIAKDTVEEQVLALHNTKRLLAEDILDDYDRELSHNARRLFAILLPLEEKSMSTQCRYYGSTSYGSGCIHSPTRKHEK